MPASITAEWKFRGLQAIILENELVRAVVLPELGAKIWEITYKPKERQWLWHHPRLRPRLVPFHSVYDDTFFGGWDELFPNDIPEMINSETEPDHGEIWTLPWEFLIEKHGPDEVCLHLWVDTAICTSRVEKWLSLRSGEPVLRFRHRIANVGPVDLPFLWKLHAAMAIDEYCRIDMPAGRMLVLDFGPTRFGETNVEYKWPFFKDRSGFRHDMRQTLPASSQVNEFQIATELRDGWCALTHTRDRLGFALRFDRRVLPSCWLFATYGGWRGLYTVILEPCSGYPVSVREGVSAGTHRTLKAGQAIECHVLAVLFEGLSEVASVGEDGSVTGQC